VSLRVATAFAPGRVNLIGEHTDYNDGLALAFAVGSGVTVSATAGPGERLEVIARDLRERDSFSRDSPEPAVGWRAYVRGTVAELRQHGYAPAAARLEITSDLPAGAGLASSAALTLAVSLSLIALTGEQPPDPTELARICQRVETRWAGADTGLLDQLASLCGSAGRALLIDFLTLERQTLACDLGDCRLVLLPAGQARSNAASGYNQRRSECWQAAQRMRVESLREATIQDLHMLPDTLAHRARHVIGENGRVLAAARALRERDMEALGELLDRSHASLRDEFEVSTDAVEAAVAGLKAAGALGARLMGGGFGGSVLALMPQGAPVPAGATLVAPGPGARLIG
jgi:galactokinase